MKKYFLIYLFIIFTQFIVSNSHLSAKEKWEGYFITNKNTLAYEKPLIKSKVIRKIKKFTIIQSSSEAQNAWIKNKYDGLWIQRKNLDDYPEANLKNILEKLNGVYLRIKSEQQLKLLKQNRLTEKNEEELLRGSEYLRINNGLIHRGALESDASNLSGTIIDASVSGNNYFLTVYGLDKDYNLEEPPENQDDKMIKVKLILEGDIITIKEVKFYKIKPGSSLEKKI